MSSPDTKPIRPIDLFAATLLTLGWLVVVMAIVKPWMSAVLGQWAASYDGDAAGMFNYEELSRTAEVWHLRLAAALVGGPAVIALAALARGLPWLAAGYAVATAVMAIPAGILAIYSL